MKAACDVILLGASTRAAAMSARRAGMAPWCADLFADADLERIATVRRVPVDAYPEGLLAALAEAPRVPVIYTGALENCPDLIDRIDRPLWGNSPTVLRAVRSPERWTQCLHDHGLPHPLVADQPMAAGRWLLKPRRSGGGFGIHVYRGQTFNPRTHFLQQHIDGMPCSAIYLARNDDAILLGVTRQLIGVDWLNARGLLYAGNIGPLPLDHAAAELWSALGTALAQTFHLRGLFGVDAIVCDEAPWPIEINPRYTASMEVLERSDNLPLLALHREAFVHLGSAIRSDVANAKRELSPHAIWGKAILYARAAIAFPAHGPWTASADYADIPHAGEVIESGRPVLTLFASAATVDECERNLQEKAQTLDRALRG